MFYSKVIKDLLQVYAIPENEQMVTIEATVTQGEICSALLPNLASVKTFLVFNTFFLCAVKPIGYKTEILYVSCFH